MSQTMKEEKQELIDKILRLKKEKGAVILAHNYQIPEIQEIGEFLGDSLELARISREFKEDTIAFCGVRFMAETIKILSPHKKVLLPVRDAGCPMAEMIEVEDLIQLKNQHPRAAVVSYVNTYAPIKALSDVCCTSANAVKVVKNLVAEEIIFVPDRNLAWWVAEKVPEKKFIIWKGFCLVHEYFSYQDLEQARKIHPDAEIMVHPECRPEVLKAADIVLSTSGMLKQAKISGSRKFIVGTEEGLIYRLKKENPDKTFYSLGSARTCVNMKRTTLNDLYRALDKDEYCIELNTEIMDKARSALERMIQYA